MNRKDPFWSMRVDIGKPCENCGGPIKARNREISWARKHKRFCCFKCSGEGTSKERDNMEITAAMRASSHTPEVNAKRAEALRNSPKRVLITALAHSPEAIKKANKARSKIPGFQSIPENFSAVWWRVRDYRGVIHEFRNLSYFIKTNPDLFLPEDINWQNVPRGRAYGGIRSLRPNPTRKKVNGSWKGWTWYSQTERLKNEGHDLLDRKDL